jgi:hypothetical protein
MGYFASRAAPLGAVSSDVVEATFYNFAPEMVSRAIPEAWRICEPRSILGSRRRSAAKALRRLVPGIEIWAGGVASTLSQCIYHPDVHASGRTLFGANRGLQQPDDPVEALWQAATTLREHRGDGHIAVLLANGITGCEPHLLVVAEQPEAREILQANRGWTDGQWERSTERLKGAGVISGDGRLTDEGVTMRRNIEKATEDLASVAFHAIGSEELSKTLDLVIGAAMQLGATGIIPYPNPIGLPAVG